MYPRACGHQAASVRAGAGQAGGPHRRPHGRPTPPWLTSAGQLRKHAKWENSLPPGRPACHAVRDCRRP